VATRDGHVRRRSWSYAITIRAALAGFFWWIVATGSPSWLWSLFLIFALFSTAFLVALIWAAHRSTHGDP
jgi:hypothetical protein